MGLNFKKSFKVAPGVRVNVGKKSIGVSAGVKGARVSANTKGQKRASASVPGTGLSYTKNISSSSQKTSKQDATSKNAGGCASILFIGALVPVLIKLLF